MARIQKRTRADGRAVYIVKWYTPDGKDRTKGGFATKRAAQAHATKVESGKLRGVDVDPKSGEATFREAAKIWLTSRHDLKETTRAAYSDALAPNNGSKRHKRLETLRIDAVFGGYPLNTIRREHISDWVQRMGAAGRSPSTIRNAYFLVRMVLGQAVEDGRIPANPADYVRLPSDHSSGRNATVDDPAMFLTASQIDSLVAATPWPANVLVYVAAWTGLRAAEIAGLQIADVALPQRTGQPLLGTLRVERTVQRINGELRYVQPKTRGSRRKVPLTEAASGILRDYLALHPRRHEPTAPLFPAVSLTRPRPTGRKNPAGVSAAQQTTALAGLSVDEAEARLEIDWSQPHRHGTWYKAIWRPAILRANRLYPSCAISSALRFHGLRHSYASLAVAAGLKPLAISRYMGHNKPTTTLGIYAHLFEDSYDDDMIALGLLSRPAVAKAGNVIPLRG